MKDIIQAIWLLKLYFKSLYYSFSEKGAPFNSEEPLYGLQNTNRD